MILDTCALLWLAGGEQHRISEKTLDRIERTSVACIVSITGFEIGIKYRSGKLHLPTKPGEWLSLAIEFHQLEIIELDVEICLRASQLPPIHKDPCDRFIIAAAQLRGMPVVTADRRFPEYGIKIFN